MKFQLVILCSLFAFAFAWPVPDEEVSAVRPVAVNVPEVQPVVKEVEQKPVEDVKPESRSVLEEKAKQIEFEKKIDLPPSTPDAELTPILPEKKDEQKQELASEIKQASPAILEKKEEIKTEKIEKQTRSEVVEHVHDPEVKALPVVVAPVAHVGEEKQVVQEGKSVVHDVVPEASVVPEGKSAELPTEEKKDDLIPAASTPIVKSEIAPEPLALPAASAPIAEETAPRQERVNAVEDKVEENKVDHVQVIKPAEPAVVSSEAAVVPAVKSLNPIEQQPQTEAKPIEEPVIEGEQPKESELKTTPLEEKPATTGDITAQPLAEAKDLKVVSNEQPKEEHHHHENVVDNVVPQAPVNVVPEAKKIEEASPEAPATPIAEQSLKEEAKPIQPAEEKPSQPLKTSSESKSDDSKESDESKESKESEESGEKSD